MLSRVLKAARHAIYLTLPIISAMGLAFANTPDQTGITERAQPPKGFSKQFTPFQAKVTKSGNFKAVSCQAKKSKSGYESIELDTPGGENWQLVVNHVGIQPLDKGTLRVKESN